MLLRRLGVLAVALGAVACPPSGGPIGACASLSACCTQAGGENQTACADTLSAGIDSVCESELQNLEAEGSCGADAGTAACATLTTCCAGMAAASSSSCTRIASLNDNATCEQQLSFYQSNGTCNVATVAVSGFGRDGSAGDQ